ncbi:acyl-CoA thioesterase [Rhodohalobacter sp. SW132]|uniref:acyl-CoA thioesterase n=1 Tax=Rhodohalobacter sp. SW132 TaxID=2293433 RepID=UPI000E265A1B|nr:thioesterase family protein [Rhodohalobacter sp. SW132]REL24567.1 acyl-CoA thioesterase [Rhodohalobacter sp. SW132]
MIQFPDRQPIISSTHTLRSRYGETDQMGYVYYGRYPEFFEVARTEMMRDAGLTYRKLEEDGFMLPVISMEIDYRKPVLYDEEMQIEVMLFDRPHIKLHTYYRITTSRSSKPHVNGKVTLCFVDAETRKPVEAPNALIERIRKE